MTFLGETCTDIHSHQIGNQGEIKETSLPKSSLVNSDSIAVTYRVMEDANAVASPKSRSAWEMARQVESLELPVRLTAAQQKSPAHQLLLML